MTITHIDKLRIDVTGITEDDARLLANLVAQGLVPALDATPGYASVETLKVNVTAAGDLGSQAGAGGGGAQSGGTASGAASGVAGTTAGSSGTSGSGIRALAAQIVDQISVAVSGRVAGTLGEGIPS